MSNGPRRGRDLFRVNAITAGCLVALVASGAAQAQQQQLDTVVVTGIRKGIEDAISVKKNKDSIVESISAEDIGKLPDASVAESIARLPGVTAQRTAGRAQQISIRGMAPDFATALLNGREQVTTGDSRGVEFDQYPSELLAGVDIYKTPDGALVGQGLSGTIDLKTVRPLNFGKRAFAVSAREQRTGEGLPEGQQGDGRRYNVSYVDQFLDRKLGVALGWARFTEDGAKTNRFEGWGTADTAFQGGTVKTPGGFNAWQDQTVQTRTGTMGVIQVRPNKQFEAVLDLFYSKFERNKATKGFQAPVGFGEQTYDLPGQLTTATVSNGIATSGTFNNFKGVIRNDTEYFDDSVRSAGLNVKFKGDVWTTVVDVHASNAKRTGAILETTAGIPGNRPANTGTISWTGFDGNNIGAAQFNTSVSGTDRNAIRLTDVMGWGGGPNTPQAGYSKIPNVEDDLQGGRIAFSRDLPEGLLFSSVDLGFNQVDREKTRAYVEGRLIIAGSGGPAQPYASAPIPGSGSITVAGIPIATFDPAGSVGSIFEVASKQHPDIANKDWTVGEEVSTAYAKFNLDTEVAGIPVRGNAGLQLVHTSQFSSAFNVDSRSCANDVCTLGGVRGSTSYNDVLPSLNLVFDLGSDQVLRLGAARVMARPTLNDMRASLGFGLDNNNGAPILKGGAGNPYLKPFRANAIDLSYEKYWGNKAYVGVAAFHKDLRTYILRKDVPFDFAPFITNPSQLPQVGPNAGKSMGLLNQPINGTGGDIKGVELSASLPLEMLWKPLDGFGFYASYSTTSSSINLATTGITGADINTGTIPLPGLSKKVASAQVYFEKWGFQARISQRYRSAFVGEITDGVGDRRLTYIKGESVTDAQIGYEFQTGFAKGLSLLLQGYNLGNAEFIRYRDTPANEVERTKYGKTYLLGLSYKL
jgi:iron complex outermembrane receptor protein